MMYLQCMGLNMKEQVCLLLDKFSKTLQKQEVEGDIASQESQKQDLQRLQTQEVVVELDSQRLQTREVVVGQDRQRLQTLDSVLKAKDYRRRKQLLRTNPDGFRAIQIAVVVVVHVFVQLYHGLETQPITGAEVIFHRAGYQQGFEYQWC